MPNAPAKRAAYLMITIGVLLLAGSFVSTMFALLRPEWIDAQLRPYHEALADNPLLRRPTLAWLIAISGGLGLLESGLSIALGLYILRGRAWAIVTSLVLTLLRLLIIGLLALLSLLVVVLEQSLRSDAGTRVDPGASSAGASLGMSLLWSVGAAVVLIVLAVWLVQAMRVEKKMVHAKDSSL